MGENCKTFYIYGNIFVECLLFVSLNEGKGELETKSVSFFRPYISVYAVKCLLPWLTLLPSLGTIKRFGMKQRAQIYGELTGGAGNKPAL